MQPSARPFSYGMNIFKGCSSLLLCSELWFCKVFLIVLFMTFNRYPFHCMVFLIYNNSSFKDVWLLQINFGLLIRVLIIDTVTCSSWFDEKWVYWPDELVFYIPVIISLFSFKLIMQFRNGKFPSDNFSIVNSHHYVLMNIILLLQCLSKIVWCYCKCIVSFCVP